MRRILQQLQTSTFPQSIGACADNISEISAIVNMVTQRLMLEGGETGWWGGWAKVLFTVTKSNPYITLPPQFARAINLAVCNTGIRIQNEFYELLEAGIGLQPQSNCEDWCGALEGFERGLYSTMADLPSGDNSLLRLYLTNASDAGKRILFQQAKDQNGKGIYSVDGYQNPNGFYMTLNNPSGVSFVTSDFIVTGWESIAKDVTYGDVILKAVDATTGKETTLSRFLPWETNPAYRRYYINALPTQCCTSSGVATTNIPITALCKYEFVPVSQPTDQLIIGNIPALESEALAYLDEKKEDDGAAGRAMRHHRKAIELLNSELGHYLGKLRPAINFAPWGTARLERKKIGTLV